MNVKEENIICRLCLKVAENELKIIDDIKRQMFEYLSLNVNLDRSKDPVICEYCTEALKKSINFISAFIATEEHTFPFTVNKNEAKFELKNLYKEEKDVMVVDDNFMCAFCSKLLRGNNIILLDTLIRDVKFQALIPKKDFNFIKNSRICTSCTADLERCMKFVENCSDVEKKINEYCQNEGVPSSGQVVLSEVLRFLFKNVDFDYKRIIVTEQDIGDIRKPNPDDYKVELIKAEEVLDIKEHGVNLNEKKYELQSNKSSSETGVEKPFRTKHEGAFNEKNYHMLSTKHVSEPRTFKCASCIYETNRSCNLKRHMLIHKNSTEVEIYKCTTCNYETKHKSTLKNHTITHKDKTDVDMFKCPICTYETKYKRSLKRHTLIHKHNTEVDMYKCSTCNYETKHKNVLKNHTLTHKHKRDVETFKCPICTYETKYKRSLKGHMLIHKDVTEVDTYKCSTCTYQTKYKDVLKNHMLTHKSIKEVDMFKCSMCIYAAKHKSNLKSHMLIHKDDSDVEMHKCSTCTYETKHKSSLKRHMLIHKNITEVEIYKCSMCIFETIHKTSLRYHMLIHKDH